MNYNEKHDIVTLKEYNAPFLVLLNKKIGKEFLFQFTCLSINGDKYYISDGNLVIYLGKDIYLNIFAFEGEYFKIRSSYNSIRFFEYSTPCFFNSIPIKNMTQGLSHPTVEVYTAPYGKLTEVELYYNNEICDDETAVITKALVFRFEIKVVCFIANYQYTNRMDVEILPVEDLEKLKEKYGLFLG